MPFASASGATIHYSVEGAGESVCLLLPGLGGRASEWREPFVNELARERRVVLMDHRGIDQSRTSAERWTLGDMAADALAVLDALSLTHADVLGISMGGMIAQLMAAESPARVRKLVLMATSFGGTGGVPGSPAAVTSLGPKPGLSSGDNRRNSLRALTAPGFADTHPALIDALAAERDRAPTEWNVFQRQFEALLFSDRSELVRSIRSPTLVLHGAQDPLIPLENGRRLSQRIPGARLLVLDGCGHLPHLEKPMETANGVRAFLAE